MGPEGAGAESSHGQASVLRFSATSDMPGGVVHDEKRAAKVVVRESRCHTQRGRAEGSAFCHGRPTAKDGVNDISGKGGHREHAYPGAGDCGALCWRLWS